MMVFIRPQLARELGLTVREASGPVAFPRGGVVGDDWSALGWEVDHDDYASLTSMPPAFWGPDGAATVNPALLPPQCREGGQPGAPECGVRRQNVAQMMGIAVEG